MNFAIVLLVGHFFMKVVVPKWVWALAIAYGIDELYGSIFEKVKSQIVKR